MPSDDRRLAALQFLTRERDSFRAAVSNAADQVRALVSSAAPADTLRSRAAAQLGAFASGHIDTERFGAVFTSATTIAPETVGPLRYVQCLLTATITVNEDAFLVSVQPGEDLREIIVRELSVLGRVFAAAHAVSALRKAPSEAESAEPLLARFPPDRWTRAERALAPPLVVELNGADLRVGGLEELLQGAQKIVLLVKGAAPPAALVRLITPNVFVMQCRELADLAELAAHNGPGIAAVLEAGLPFVFKPANGKPGVLELRGAAPETPRRRLGRITAFQQTEELQWLLRLSAPPEPQSAGPATEAAANNPGDQLAAWLLRQARL
jgi:hypothetical protein